MNESEEIKKALEKYIIAIERVKSLRHFDEEFYTYREKEWHDLCNAFAEEKEAGRRYWTLRFQKLGISDEKIQSWLLRSGFAKN